LCILRNAMWCGTNWCAPLSAPISSTVHPHANKDRHVRLSQTRTTHQARLGLPKNPSPPAAKRAKTQSGIRTVHEGVDLRRVRCRPGVSCFQRSTAGADKEFCDCIAGFSDGDYAAVDQPTKEFFAKFADFADFRRHSGATRGHEALVGDL